MSHFTVLVIGENVEDILAPYDENMEVAPHIDREKWQIHKEFIDFRGRLIVENKPSDMLDEFDKLTLSLESENAEWVKKWCGQTLDKDGNTLTTYNPNSKWDWYQIGGRWSGSLILKSGGKGKLGEKSWFNKDVILEDNCVDQAYKDQIDWDAMNQIARDQAAKDWGDLMDPDPDKCFYRPEYVAKQRELHLRMYGTKEEYVKRRGIWTPYAYVSEYGWEAPGDMGWWGMSSDETEDRDKYDQEFAEYIETLPGDVLLTIVDCHI